VSGVKLADVREGDVIRVSYQVAVLDEPDEDGDVRIHEPGTGERGWILAHDLETLEATVELVSREPEFKVGDLVLYGGNATEATEAVVISTNPKGDIQRRPYRVWVEEDQDWYAARHDEVFTR